MSITDLNFVYDFLLQVWKQDLEVVPERFHPIPSFEEHYKLIKDEQAAGIADKASSRRTVLVNERIMGYQQTIPTDFGGDIDWEFELSGFHQLDYPSYYTQPFHSIPGGWMSKFAAENNRIAMQAIYKDAHAESCFGVRKQLSEYIPPDSKLIVDLGCGDGDGAAATARMYPGAKVVGIDASPFMIVAGRRQNRDCANLEYRHQLAEETFIPSNSVDTVTLTLVLHECSDEGKRGILKEAFRILRPGGTIVLIDTPQSDLLTFRGFYEPWKHQWVHFNATQFLTEAGFETVIDHGILGGDGVVKTVEEQKGEQDQTTNNRLFVFEGKKSERIRAKL
jgi:SAM-dependent methyltransferase